MDLQAEYAAMRELFETTRYQPVFTPAELDEHGLPPLDDDYDND